jgi:hypothetical protein
VIDFLRLYPDPVALSAVQEEEDRVAPVGGRGGGSANPWVGRLRTATAVLRARWQQKIGVV